MDGVSRQVGGGWGRCERGGLGARAARAWRESGGRLGGALRAPDFCKESVSFA